jgi:hypothetical protein
LEEAQKKMRTTVLPDLTVEIQHMGEESKLKVNVRTSMFLSIFHHPTIFKVNDYTSTSLNEALTILSQVRLKGGTAQERSSRYTVCKCLANQFELVVLYVVHLMILKL